MTESNVNRAAAGALLGIALVVGGAFTVGMHVGTNDTRIHAAKDDMVLHAISKQCGKRGHALKTDAGYRCVYVNNDGSAVTRPVFNSPINRGEM